MKTPPISSPILAAGLSGLLFTLACAPGLTWLDAGELGAAAAELGVAHPPGMPVFILLHKLVMTLVPVGDLAFRGNLASATLAAAAIGFLVAALRVWRVPALPAFAAGMLVATAGLFARHATTIEVYSGMGLWVTASIWMWAKWRSDGDARWTLALVLTIGLAAGHHAEIRLLALPIVGALLIYGTTHRRVLVAGVIAGLIGAAVISYLPLRAAAEPWRNWGDPSSLSTLWAHLMGARIRAAYTGVFGVVSWSAIQTFCSQLWGTSPVLLVLGLLGALRSRRHDGAWLIGAVFLLDAVYAVALNPMGLRDLQNGIPALAALGLSAGLALGWVVEWSERAWTGWLALGLIGISGVLNASELTARVEDRGLTALLDDATDAMPPETLMLVSSDDFAAGMAFQQTVEGARPDLAVVVRQHAWDASSLDPVRRRLPNSLKGWSGTLPSIERLSDPRWPLWWEWAEGSDAEARPSDLSAGIPFLTRGGPATGLRSILTHLESLGTSALADTQAKQTFARLASEWGQILMTQQADGPAVVLAFQIAAEIQPDTPRRWNNLATSKAYANDVAGAIAAVRRGLELAPKDPTLRANLVRYLLRAKETVEAHRVVEALVADSPQNADALALRGIMRANQKDFAGAKADFDAALSINPAHREARVGLNTLRRVLTRQTKKAAQ